MNLRLGHIYVETQEKGKSKYQFALVGENDNLVHSASSLSELGEKIKKDSGEKKIKLLKEDEEFIHILPNPESTKNVKSPKGESTIIITHCKSSFLHDLYLAIGL